jgi:polar amino acid transport system substrate-binding protein
MSRQLLATILGTTTILAGCGQGNDQESGGATDALAQIRDRGEVRVFMEAQFPPWEFYDESGTLTGLDVELANTMFGDDLGVEVTFEDIGFSGLLPALSTRKADVLVSAIGYTEERAEKFDFSIPYAVETHQLTTLADSPLNSLEDLSGKIVGAQIATTHEESARAYSDELEAGGQPGIKEIRTYERVPLEVEDLLRGRVDAIVDSPVVLAQIASERGVEFKSLGVVGEPLYIAIVVRQGDTALLEFVNSELRKFKEDGTLAALQEKWFGFENVGDLPESLPSV